MRVRNRHHGIVNVAGLSIAPRRIGTIDDDAWREWLARSTSNRELAARCLEIYEPPEEAPSVDRVAVAAEAIRGMSTDDESLWTQSGLPTVGALRQLTGFGDLSSGERDKAWWVFNGNEVDDFDPAELHGEDDGNG